MTKTHEKKQSRPAYAKAIWTAFAACLVVVLFLAIRGIFTSDERPNSTRQYPLDDLGVSPSVSTNSPQGGLAKNESSEINTTYSNVYPGDYVGPHACAECHRQNHRENYASWRKHPHSNMNMNATPETIMGDFSGTRIIYGDGEVQFDYHDNVYTMTLYLTGRKIRRYRVTRTVGSRFLQYYIGMQLEGPEPPGHLIYNTETRLPFGYLFKLQRWLPHQYFDSFYPPEYSGGKNVHADEIYRNPILRRWDKNCLICHNTFPFAYRMTQHQHVSGFPMSTARFQNADFPADTGHSDKLRTPITPSDLTTLGISCESCHFGGRAHVIEGHPISFVPTSPHFKFLDPVTGEKLVSDQDNPRVVNSICAQCHVAIATRYPDGSAVINSSEYFDLSNGACASQIKCTDCHNPHQASLPGGSPDRAEHIQTCINCHQQFSNDRIVAEHTRHPTSADVSCLDCHMPRLVQGLETVTRSHRISSPTHREMLASGSPNACNLCHLEKPITWTLQELEKGWGKKITPDDGWLAAYDGDLSTPVGLAWLRSSKPTVRLVASYSYSQSRIPPSVLPSLLNNLDDPYAVNRVFAMMDVQRILGAQLDDSEYNLLAPRQLRRQQIGILAKRIEAVLGRD